MIQNDIELQAAQEYVLRFERILAAALQWRMGVWAYGRKRISCRPHARLRREIRNPKSEIRMFRVSIFVLRISSKRLPHVHTPTRPRKSGLLLLNGVRSGAVWRLLSVTFFTTPKHPYLRRTPSNETA
jgi:hypothetical protein